MKKLLEPMDIARCKMGTWINPFFDSYLNEVIGDKKFISQSEWDDMKKHFNIDTVTIWMESSINSDDWEKMMDDCDITKWDPIAPTGFFLIDIGFSEDDAYAIFARNKRETELT